MIVLALFFLSVICFSLFLRYFCTVYSTLYYLELILHSSLLISCVHYFSKHHWIFLWGIGSDYVSYFYIICLYNARNECYIRDIYSLQQLACLSVFSLIQPNSQTHHLPYGSKTLFSSLHFPLRISSILSNPFQMTSTPGSCLISPLSCVYVMGGVWHEGMFTLCIIILYYGIYYALFFYLRKSVCICVSIWHESI